MHLLLLMSFMFLGFIFCIASPKTHKEVQLRPNDSLYVLGSYMEFYEDTTDSKTILDVRKAGSGIPFYESPSDVPSFTTRHPVWSRFQLVNLGLKRPFLQVISSSVDSLDLYLFDSTGREVAHWQRKTIGLSQEQSYHLPSFVFELPETKNLHVFLRMHSTASLIFKVHAGSQRVIYDTNIIRIGLHCLYFGMVMIMVLYNFFIFLSTRDWAYFFYILFGVFFACHVAHLQGFDIYLPDNLAYIQKEYFRVVAMLCTGLGGCFALVFLRVRTYLPRAYYLYIFCIAASFANLFYSILGGDLFVSYLAMQLCSSVPLIVYLITSFLIYKRGYTPALFFFIAFMGFEIFLVLTILLQLGVIPNFSLVTEYFLHIGSAFELLALSLALAYRINLLKKEKAKIKMEHLRLVAEQNQLLELQVAKRTAKIETQKEELAAANEKMKELDKFKNGMMSVVAHDLRAPLNRVKGLAELLLMKQALNNEQKEYVSLILRSSNSGLAFIRDFMLINSADNDSFSIQFSPLDIHTFLREESILYSHFAQAKGIQIKCLLQDHPLVLNTDEVLLTRIMENLIGNAIKFSNSGADVIIGVRETDAAHEIFVKDQGPGFTEEDRAKMFAKFQKLSAKPTGGEESTGLGLAIVKALSDRLGITLVLESVVGEGSTFILQFKK